MSEFYNADEYLSIKIHKPSYDRKPYYKWSISTGNDSNVLAKGKALTARGALRAVQKAHGKIERNKLKLNGSIRYQLFLGI